MKLKFINFENCQYFTYETESFIFDSVCVLRIFQVDKYGGIHIKTVYSYIEDNL